MRFTKIVAAIEGTCLAQRHRAQTETRMVRSLTYATIAALFLTNVASCSLISIKSPEKPLSTRDLNARILTHEFSAHFITAVEQGADDIAAGTDNPAVRLNSLRWKIAAASTSERAASQIAPVMAVLDTWALAVQMHEYLANGPGGALFDTQQPQAVTLAADLAGEAEDMARRVLAPDEFDKDRRFIEDYARSHPIEALSFARASIVDSWMRETGAQTKLVDSLGTVPEAIAEARDLVRMYGDTAASQALWKAQLVAQESGISGKEVQATLQKLDERIARIAALTDAMPQLVSDTVRDVRGRLNVSWTEALTALHSEGGTLSATIDAESKAAADAVDKERAAVAADATRIASQVIRDAGEEARRIVREALLLVIALAVVVLGLPFVAGYLLGRARTVKRL
jgi:hypothetical protein